jgi:acyl-coenzyme A synthetase/AMP-(fatty) acid ligase
MKSVSMVYKIFDCDRQMVLTKSTDPSLIYFTSGTTGKPKMVEHSHMSYGLGHKVTARFETNLFNDLKIH